MAVNKKALVIKLCCLGDIIQLTPAMRALTKAGYDVHLLCVPWVNDVADMVPFIRKKHLIDTRNIFSLASVILRLRAEKFDIALNFHRDQKSYLFCAAAGAKQTAGFSWEGRGKGLTRAFPYDPALHEADRYLSVVEGLGIMRDGGHTEIKAPALDVAALTAGKGPKKIGMFPAGGNNPGTVMPTKRWPAEKFAALAGMFKRKGYDVYLFGAGFDRDVVESVRKLEDAKVIISPLKEFAACAEKMDLFVACDTGPLHIASALGVRTIGLFGPSSPDIFGARGRRSVNIHERGMCGRSPCYEPVTVGNREFLSCRDNICMKAITPERVFEEAERLLNSDKTP